jgi:hypothetical protein
MNLGKPNSAKATQILAAIKTFGLALTGVELVNSRPNTIGYIWITVYAIDFVVSLISKPDSEK